MPETLLQSLAASASLRSAARVVMEWLIGRDLELPSLYVERDGFLRCLAARGYWQVYDGIPPRGGVIGRTMVGGKAVFIPDVADDSDYVAAAPGVVSEVCVPFFDDRGVAGILNVESRTPLMIDAVEPVQFAADAFSRWLSGIGGRPPSSGASRLAWYSARLAGLSDEHSIHELAVEALREVAGMSSGAVCLAATPPSVPFSAGPLAPLLRALPSADLRSLVRKVGTMTSYYTFGDTRGLSTHDLSYLRANGVQSTVALSLQGGGRSLGAVVLADHRPVRHDTAAIATLELFCSQVASSLVNAESTAALRASETRFRALAEHASDLVCLHDPNGVIVYASPSARNILGYEPADLVGAEPRRFVAEPDPARMEVLRQLFLQGTARGSVEVTFRAEHRDGHPVWLETSAAVISNEGGGLDQVQTISRDVSARMADVERLHRMAQHDGLTGLANRNLLRDRLQLACDLLGRGDGALGVLFLDLDGFKEVNDTFGHDAGDRLLVAAAERIRGCARQSDTVARYGGDEFTIVCPDLAGAHELRAVADRARDALRTPFVLGDLRLQVAVSIGGALTSRSPGDVDALLREADLAMYRAKQRRLLEVNLVMLDGSAA